MTERSIHPRVPPAGNAPPASVSIRIERLVVHGVDLPSGAQAELRAAFEGQLQLLLLEGHAAGATLGRDSVRVLSAPNLSIPPSPNPEHLGRQLAGAVHGALVAPR
jgi:hypothetical protein